jgi:aminoglycoside 6'-N-acetyltransferase I
MLLRPLEAGDASRWLPLRQALWPDLPRTQLEEELTLIVTDERQVAIGAFEGARLVGFVELSLHPHAVGCCTRPVAYLEAWYVESVNRRRGVGRRLVCAGEAWARAQGCRELASDTWLDHATSQAAHLALGFAETTRLVHYRKAL